MSDLEKSRRFWESLAPALGLQVETARFERMVAVAGDRRHLMLVADGRPPTRHLHIAFPALAGETAAEFHDPDGNRIEAVSRNR